MASRFRQFIEKILYAGLKPNAPPKESNRGRWLGRLSAAVERFLAGRAPTDPLYLTNRTLKQKLTLAVAVAVPALFLLAVMAVAFSNLFSPSSAPPHEPTPAEVVAKLLPDLEKTIEIDVNKDAELVEVHVERSSASPRITGLLRNRTDRPISVEFALELTDDAGSRLGAVVGRVDKAPPKNTIPFQFPIKQENAAFALVREMHTIQ